MVDLPMTMPGTFSFDSEDDFSRPGAKPSFHIPPSPASSVLSRSISKNLSNSSLHCRKRPRIDASNDFGATPRVLRRNDVSTTSFSFDAPSPTPLVNTEYRIAGGLDTPTAELVRQEEQAQLDFERDLRPSRYTFAPQQQAQDYFLHTPTFTNIESRKRKLQNSPKSPKSGWGRTVWTLAGGMAGKVINFCWNTAFHGFHAGAGPGYHMQIDTPTVTAHHNTELRGNVDVFDANYRWRGSTPIPGGFPEETFIEEYMSKPQAHQQIETPTQSTDTGAGSSLKTNWVLVNEPYTDMEGSPARKRSRPSTLNTHMGPNARASFPIRPRTQARASMSGASYASPRSSGSNGASQHIFRPQTSDSSHRQHKRARSSIAHPQQSVGSEQSTPKSPDVVKFEKKMRKKDQRQDESLRRLNQQMQDMIKEAQQALGSKVEVVDDEGYAEGTDGSSSEAGRWY